MAFVTSLATYVGGTRLDEDPPITVLRGAGVMAGVTTVLAALVGGAMAAGVTFAPDFESPGGELIRSLDQLSIGIMLVGTGWSTAGLVAAALLLLSPVFLPFILVLLRALITGIVVLRSEGRTTNDPLARRS